MESIPEADVTGLLRALSAGGQEALGHLVAVLYQELRRIAYGYTRREREGHTLQTSDRRRTKSFAANRVARLETVQVMADSPDGTFLNTAALDREPTERAAFLKKACSDDRELYTEIESLLAFDGRKFLARDQPVAGRRLVCECKAPNVSPSAYPRPTLSAVNLNWVGKSVGDYYGPSNLTAAINSATSVRDLISRPTLRRSRSIPALIRTTNNEFDRFLKPHKLLILQSGEVT
jgi:hypothetical protein